MISSEVLVSACGFARGRYTGRPLVRPPMNFEAVLLLLIIKGNQTQRILIIVTNGSGVCRTKNKRSRQKLKITSGSICTFWSQGFAQQIEKHVKTTQTYHMVQTQHPQIQG